jgi:hypothetical protein
LVFPAENRTGFNGFRGRITRNQGFHGRSLGGDAAAVDQKCMQY